VTSADASAPPTSGQAPDPSAGTSGRRFHPRYLAYVLLIVVVATSVFVLVKKASQGSGTLNNSAIERLIPTAGAKILQQDIIGIDLAPGYEGTIALNGEPLPLDQVTVVAPLNQVTFKPGPGKIYESLPTGENCLVATYWMSSKGPAQASLQTWCFTVL
jgi:hypothetical protein